MPEVVAGAVHHPAPVLLALVAQRVLEVDRQQAPLGELLGDDPDRRGVHVAEGVAGLGRGQAGLLGGEHRVVDLALLVGEPAVDRQRAGDVGGVERVDLDAGVDQDQVAVADLAVVADPVQRAGVLARRRRWCRSRARCRGGAR